MIPREIQTFVHELIESYPIVSIVGPRQSGKTTLAKTLFPGYGYVSLEDPDIRREAQYDMRDFLRRHRAPMIFDEFQRVPELSSYLQTIVDQEDKPGMYILTGSHQPDVRSALSQSLAGRVGLVDLLPLSISEMKAAGHRKTRDEWMVDGFMPRQTRVKIRREQFFRDYFRTYIERDAKQLIQVRKADGFERFIRLLAGRVGQVLNVSSLANDSGMSVTTLKTWIQVLEASYIVYILKPYYRNYGKRLIKAPKIYFTETGLVAYLLGIRNAEQMSSHPLVGNLFENMVVGEVLKTRLNAGRSPDLYFFRDSQGFEVDLILEEGTKLRPIEIKSSMTFSPDFSKGIERFQKLVPEATDGMVLYAGNDVKREKGVSYVNFESISQTLLSGEESS